MMKNVFVTGGNAGIGLALCKQLAVDYGCRVFMGSRNAERGQAAVDSIELPSGCPGSVELVLVDVADDSSVAAAACYVEGLLGGEKIYGLVNNAGVGLAAKASCDDVVNTNLFGPKRMFEAFSTLLDDATGRVVNVGSGSGPNFVKGCPQEMQNRLCTEPESWSQNRILAFRRSDRCGIASKFKWGLWYFQGLLGKLYHASGERKSTPSHQLLHSRLH